MPKPPRVWTVITEREPNPLSPGAPILSEAEGWAELAQTMIALLQARRARRLAKFCDCAQMPS